MIRLYGKATVSTWRPIASGGGSEMRSSQRESDDVTVLDQMVILQHHDGFWETYPLINCSIIWQGKPTVTLLTEEDKETLLPLSGRDHTMADELAQHRFAQRGPTRPMETSGSAIEGAEVVTGGSRQNGPMNEGFMSDETPFIDQNSLINYIRAALDLEGEAVSAHLIERVLDLELEYLQHRGIAEEMVDDPRPE